MDKGYLPTLFGGFLKSELRRQRMTYADFAELCGVSERQVGRWCCEGIFNLDTADNVLTELGVALGDVVAFSEEGDDVPPFLPFFAVFQFFSNPDVARPVDFWVFVIFLFLPPKTERFACVFPNFFQSGRGASCRIFGVCGILILAPENGVISFDESTSDIPFSVHAFC